MNDPSDKVVIVVPAHVSALDSFVTFTMLPVVPSEGAEPSLIRADVLPPKSIVLTASKLEGCISQVMTT